MPLSPLAFRFALLLLASVATNSLCSAQQPARNAEAVRNVIATCDGGRAPFVWYETSPVQNLGRSGKSFTLNSGGEPKLRGLDPWGRMGNAFGPTAENEGGAAISGSSAAKVMNGSAGGILFFFMVPRDVVPPVMLFSRADWGEKPFFSVRLYNGERDGSTVYCSLGYSDPVTGKSSKRELLPVSRGYWMFMAITWRESGESSFVTHWVGSLGSGQLQRGELLIPRIQDGPAPFYVGGRKPGPNYAGEKISFRDGLFSNFAITESELSPATVESIFNTAIHR